MSIPNPSGKCMCGCGGLTRLAPQTMRSRGWVAGEPLMFIKGHSSRAQIVAPDFSVDPASGCWIWAKATANGYGVKRVGGRNVMAHRFYYEQTRGAIPAGLQLDHLCRNTGCVNPEHLEPVTNAENTRRGNRAKLTHLKAEEIRTSSESASDVAKRFGIARCTVVNIRAGRRWAT